MTDIRIRKATGTWVVRSGGAVLGESIQALELTESDLAPVIYFPRGDVATVLLDRTEKTTLCPLKGTASFFSIVNKSTVTENAVWTYENPNEEASEIKDHLAFVLSDSVKVEQL